MLPPEIEICCFSCDCTTSTAKNEWIRLDASHITPVQKPWYTATRIEEDRRSWPKKVELLKISSMSVSEASCTNCEEVLGQYCRAAGGADGHSIKETTFYDQTAIYLKNASSKAEVDPIFRQQGQKNVQSSTRSPLFVNGNHERVLAPEAPLRSTHRTSSTSPLGGLEASTISFLFAQQDMDMRKLSRGIVALEDRMLALEKSMIEVRTNLRDSSTSNMRSPRNLFDDSRHELQGAAKDVRLMSESMEDLASENERLRQRLRRIEEPHTEGECKDGSVEATAGIIATSTSVAAAEDAKKKRPYARRKALAPAKGITPGVVNADSGFVPNCDQDDSSQLGSLAALNEITAAMTRANSTGVIEISNGSADDIPNAAHHLSDTETSFNNGDNVSMSQQTNLRRTSDEMIGGGEEAEPYAQKKKSPPYDSGETTDEMMIDPALRSATTTANPGVPMSHVLSSIENPPEQRQIIQSAQQEKISGAARYDSIHEARIREYKARDALRKRKARAISIEKRRKDGDDQFRQDEKIRAREKMVKELMEREEMLEDDGDL